MHILIFIHYYLDNNQEQFWKAKALEKMLTILAQDNLQSVTMEKILWTITNISTSGSFFFSFEMAISLEKY